MRTIELTAVIGDDRQLVVSLPPDIAPGTHRVVLVIEEAPATTPAAKTWHFPVIDVGPWPEGLSLRREDMYGADGR